MKKFIALTLALLMSLSCFSLISFAEETETTEHLIEVPEGYIGIYTPDDLDNIKLDLSGSYILMNNISFEDSDYEYGGSFYNSGKGWTPIGKSYSSYFAGTFDGNGYYIDNLYINCPDEDNKGLFGYTSKATIKNLTLKNIDITANNYVGSVVGYSSSSNILNCAVSGKIYGYSNVGGICGKSYGTTSISYSSSAANVTATYSAGGICGYQNADGKNSVYNYIRYCYNSGSVTSEKGSAGGIAGIAHSVYSKSTSSISGTSVTHAYSQINDSFNCGNVNGCSQSGGILGYSNSLKRSVFVKNCINTGNTTGNDSFGAISGLEDYISATSCYYLDESVIEPTCIIGTSKSEDQLKKQTTYEGWDFDTVWTMDGREDYLYPELRDVPLVLPEDLTHKHEYSSEVTKEATHLEEGETTFTCDCGDSYTEVIAKLTGHTYEKAVTAPTCTAKGYTTYTCECGDTYVADYTDKLDHEYTSEITTPATHLTEGVKTFTCECGDSYTEPVAKLEGHTYTSEVTKEATHLEEGETTYTCACGDSYTEAISKLTGHTYKEVVTEPTCTAKGYTTYTCACGDSYVSDYVGVSEHSYFSTITTPSTHLTEGIKTYVCSGCGNEYTEKIAKNPQHTYTTSKVIKPTCTDKGYTSHYCECGDSYNDNYTSATGHKYSGQTCVNCGKKCSCNCHKTGFMGFIWKIINFFNKLFKTNKTCSCGVKHY